VVTDGERPRTPSPIDRLNCRIYSTPLTSKAKRRASTGEAVPNRQVARNGTVAERRAYTAALRERERGRDAARFRLAAELTRREQLSIPADKGYAVVAPGTLETADQVVAATNGLIDSIGHDGLVAKGHSGQKEFLRRDFLPEEAFELDSPYMRLALSEKVLGAVTAYLEMVPVLAEIDAWYSAPDPSAPHSSQLWHMDHADTTQIKVWIHCSDVGSDSGPLTILDAATSDSLAENIGYSVGESYRVPDETVQETVGTDGLVPLVGPKGTVDFVDTSRCFHFGSRVEVGAPPRRMVMLQYLTPYAFVYKADHLKRARYRLLASTGGSELERLVLGAA
jgi:hypothetical protein